MNFIEYFHVDHWTAILKEIKCVSTLVVLSKTTRIFRRQVTYFAIKNNIEWFFNCEDIASKGYLEVFKWAKENGLVPDWKILTGFDINVFNCAAENGHLSIMNWLTENGLQPDWRICPLAAKNGHLDVIKWARQKYTKCFVTYHTCFAAAVNGHVHVLEWILKNGWEWSYKESCGALNNCQVEVLKWAKTNGLKLYWDNNQRIRTNVLDYVFDWHEQVRAIDSEERQLQVFKWAKDNDAPWNSIVDDYTKSKWPDIFK